jgi:predicted peptidase
VRWWGAIATPTSNPGPAISGVHLDTPARIRSIPRKSIWLDTARRSGDTWDYVNNYPQQLAAVVPLSGGYGTASGCVLKETPAWAFNGQDDPIVAYQNQVDTVNSINACNPVERAKVTVFPRVQHNDIQGPVFNLTGLGQGLPQYDPYDQSIYDWMMQHSRK